MINLNKIVMQSTVNDQIKNKLFDLILQKNDNQSCADCETKHPTWASIDFGVLICLKCSGAHRNLGPIITRVRSTKLDNWQLELIEIFQNVTNKIANAYWEFNIPHDYIKPNFDSKNEEILKFVKNKYVHKLFAPKDTKNPLEKYKNKKEREKKGINSAINPIRGIGFQEENSMKINRVGIKSLSALNKANIIDDKIDSPLKSAEIIFKNNELFRGMNLRVNKPVDFNDSGIELLNIPLEEKTRENKSYIPPELFPDDSGPFIKSPAELFSVNIPFHLKNVRGVRAEYNKTTAYIAVIGGVLLHFILGTTMLWGGISPYVTSYFKSINPDVGFDYTNIILPLSFLGLACGMPFGVKIGLFFDFRIVCFVCILIMSLSVYISSFCLNFLTFIFFYAFIPGQCAGIIYMIPVFIGWRYFPQNEGRVSGIIIGAFGLSVFIFTTIALGLINPSNAIPSIQVKEGYTNKVYYGPEIYNNVPYMLQVLSIIYFIVGSIGSILIVPKKTFPQYSRPFLKNQDLMVYPSLKLQQQIRLSSIENECPDFITGIRSKVFLQLFFMVSCSSSFGFFMVNAYKTYGLSKIPDDLFVTIVGGVAQFINGASTPFWSTLLDKYSFKTVYKYLLLLLLTLTITLDFVSESKFCYFIWVSLIFFCKGGQFSIFPTITKKIFGDNVTAQIYGIIYFGFFIGNMISFALSYSFAQKLGYEWLFILFTLVITISLKLCIDFQEHVDWVIMMKKTRLSAMMNQYHYAHQAL